MAHQPRLCARYRAKACGLRMPRHRLVPLAQGSWGLGDAITCLQCNIPADGHVANHLSPNAPGTTSSTVA